MTAEYDLRPGQVPGTRGQVASVARLHEGGGWSWILSDLKTLLETGTPQS